MRRLTHHHSSCFCSGWWITQRPKLANMQRTRDCGVPSHKWVRSITILVLRLKDSRRVWGGKMVRARVSRHLQQIRIRMTVQLHTGAVGGCDMCRVHASPCPALMKLLWASTPTWRVPGSWWLMWDGGLEATNALVGYPTLVHIQATVSGLWVLKQNHSVERQS